MKQPPRSLSPSETMRLLAGLAIQPFLVSGLAFLTFPVLLLDRKGHTLAGGVPYDVSDAALSVALGVAVVSTIVTLAGVLPMAVWLMRRRPVSLGAALLFGLGFGNLPLVLGTALAGSYGVAGVMRGVAFSSLLGLSGAAALWAIALRGQTFNRNSSTVR
jgi:hypothetical protein